MTSQPRSQCSTCSRFRSAIGTGRDEPFCEAFPDGIPADVFGNALDHREPVPGDNDIRWSSNGAEFPEWAFDDSVRVPAERSAFIRALGVALLLEQDQVGRHLPGKHDQKSHGRRGPAALAKAAARKAARAWKEMPAADFRAQRSQEEFEEYRDSQMRFGLEVDEAYGRNLGDQIVKHELPEGTTVVTNGRGLRIVNRRGATSPEMIRRASEELDALARANALPHGVTVTFSDTPLTNAGAITNNSGRGIVFGPGVDDEPWTDGFESFFMPSAAGTTNLRYTLAHEYGHAIMYQNLSHGANSRQRYATARDKLSPYAKSDHKEGYAEAFAEFYLSGGNTPNPTVQEYAKEFGWRA